MTSPERLESIMEEHDCIALLRSTIWVSAEKRYG